VGNNLFHIFYVRSPNGVVDLVKFPNLEEKGVLMQVSLHRAHTKCMKRLRESYNKAISDINMEHIL
jgi:hypothetical protein